MFTAESDSERILKIGQHLLKLWAIKYRVVFFNETQCIIRSFYVIGCNSFPVFKVLTVFVLFGGTRICLWIVVGSLTTAVQALWCL